MTPPTIILDGRPVVGQCVPLAPKGNGDDGALFPDAIIGKLRGTNPSEVEKALNYIIENGACNPRFIQPLLDLLSSNDPAVFGKALTALMLMKENGVRFTPEQEQTFTRRLNGAQVQFANGGLKITGKGVPLPNGAVLVEGTISFKDRQWFIAEGDSAIISGDSSIQAESAVLPPPPLVVAENAGVRDVTSPAKDTPLKYQLYIQRIMRDYPELKLNELFDVTDTNEFKVDGRGYYWAKFFMQLGAEKLKTFHGKTDFRILSKINKLIPPQYFEKVAIYLEPRDGSPELPYGFRSVDSNFYLSHMEELFRRIDNLVGQGKLSEQQLMEILGALDYPANLALEVIVLMLGKGIKIKDSAKFAKQIQALVNSPAFQVKLKDAAKFDKCSYESVLYYFCRLLEAIMPAVKNESDAITLFKIITKKKPEALLILIKSQPFLKEAFKLKALIINDLENEVLVHQLKFMWFGYQGNELLPLLRELLSKNNIADLLSAAEIVGENNCRDFFEFYQANPHLWGKGSITDIAKMYRKYVDDTQCPNLPYGNIDFYLRPLFLHVNSWEQALLLMHKIALFGEAIGNYQIKGEGDPAKTLEELLAFFLPIDDQTIESELYPRLIGCLGEYFGTVKLKGQDKFFEIAARKLIDIAHLNGTPENRARLRAIHSAFERVYSSSTITLTYQKPPSADKGYRDPIYLLQRGYALIDNINGLDVNELQKKPERRENGIIYVDYHDGDGDLVLRMVKLPAAGYSWGVHLAQNRNDTPLKKFGAVVEATGANIQGNPDGTVSPGAIYTVPAELMAINGEFRQTNLFPGHDGILLIDKGGIPRVYNLANMPGEAVGLNRSLDLRREEDREEFAKAVGRMGYTVMQAPLFVHNGIPLTVSHERNPWYKRAFVIFGNGTHGFVETREPVGNVTFQKILLEMGAQHAILLDTGYFDHYQDINGNVIDSYKFNPVIIFAKPK